MKTVKISQANAPLAAYVRDITKEPVIVTRSGKAIAALVSIKNADLENINLSHNAQFLSLIERSRSRQKREGGISSKEMRRRLRHGIREAQRQPVQKSPH
ncbi:MAG: type II toxin-antitoxin system Phd/YefM family antitoxin [Candidatus Hydrogenedentes bacterium]|nr:type II toxin-antitoxin system Phd/YefM family antitoxin [Candidatus Hydrogenedentota bacterium]